LGQWALGDGFQSYRSRGEVVEEHEGTGLAGQDEDNRVVIKKLGKEEKIRP